MQELMAMNNEMVGRVISEAEHRKVEEALRESEERFRILVEKSNAGIYLIQDWVFEYVNPRLAEMLGYSVEELTAKMGPQDVVLEEDFLAYTKNNILKRLDGDVETTCYDLRLVTKDRRILYGEAYGSRTIYKGKPAIIGTMLDITERKRAEEKIKEYQNHLEKLVAERTMELAESEKKYRDLVDNALVGVYQTNLDGHVLYMNDYFRCMFGFETIDEVMSAGSKARYKNGEVREKIIEALKQTGKIDNQEVEMQTKTGRIVNVLLNATLKGGIISGMLLDITERKRAEEELKTTHQRLFDIIEFLPDATLVIDDSGKVVAWNFACEEMTGIKKEDIIGKGDYAYAVPFYGERRPILIDYVMMDSDELQKKYVSIRREGHVLYAEADCPALYNGKGAFLSGKASPLYDRAGKVVGAVESLHDLTELRRLETRLRQSQKMEAIGTLAGGIAHDFNNLLTVIAGYGALLQSNIEKTDPLQAYVDQILSSSQKAAHLTRSLLVFSRQQSITLAPLNINQLIRRTEKLLRRLLTENLTLKTLLAPYDITVMADATQIDQILLNLAVNARDAMQQGGGLTIRTELVRLDDEFVHVHGFGKPGLYVLMSVSDTGHGMDEETRTKIFDPFFTTKEIGKGTGLGLSTVYGIVKQHHGYITVYSEIGLGTTFKIYIPSTNAVSAEDRLIVPHIKKGKEKILIAEDNAEVRQFVSEILTRHGYVVIEAVDGDDAVSKFWSNPDVDLLVLDSIMPKKNGRETYTTIQTMNPAIKVLFVSGYTKDVILGKSIEDNTFDFMSKPILPNTFLLKVRQLLDG